MNDDLAILRGRVVPVVDWKFFVSDEESLKIFNSTTWEGWDSLWSGIATNATGDAIVAAGGAIHFVEHGTGSAARLGRMIDRHQEQFLSFIRKLSNFEECSASDTIPTLRQKRDELAALRKEAPKPLRECFNDAIADAKELIEDARWKQSSAGKLQAYLDLNYPTWENEIRAQWAVTGFMIRRHVSNKAVAVIGAADAESITAIVSHLSKVSVYPIMNLMKPIIP